VSYIRYGSGIDEVRELCEIANELTFIKQAGAWYTITTAIENQKDPAIQALLKKNDIDVNSVDLVDKFFKFQGMSKLSDFIEENVEIQQFLYEEIRNVL
jgi:hypothetical protein